MRYACSPPTPLKTMRKHKKEILIGIQGGIGSFNEEALRHYLTRRGIKNCKIRYLNTTMRVLSALQAGRIDRGQFAIHNSVGGIVEESLQAIARFRFKIVEQFAILISHSLMIRSDAKISEIKTIMTHPQVLAQCKQSLQKRYSHIKQTSGKGLLIDHALVAKQLAEKKLPKSVATMGSRVLAEIYNLTVVEDNLQDAKENYTSFLLVERV